MTDPLVAINKRMIHRWRQAQSCSLVAQRREKFIAAKCHLLLHNRRLDARQIAHAISITGLLDPPVDAVHALQTG